MSFCSFRSIKNDMVLNFFFKVLWKTKPYYLIVYSSDYQLQEIFVGNGYTQCTFSFTECSHARYQGLDEHFLKQIIVWMHTITKEGSVGIIR